MSLLERLNRFGDWTERHARRTYVNASAFGSKVRWAFTPTGKGKFEDHPPEAEILLGAPGEEPDSERGIMRVIHGRGFRIADSTNDDHDESSPSQSPSRARVKYSSTDHFTIALQLSCRNLPPEVHDLVTRIHVFEDRARPYKPPNPEVEVPNGAVIPAVPDYTMIGIILSADQRASFGAPGTLPPGPTLANDAIRVMDDPLVPAGPEAVSDRSTLQTRSTSALNSTLTRVGAGLKRLFASETDIGALKPLTTLPDIVEESLVTASSDKNPNGTVPVTRSEQPSLSITPVPPEEPEPTSPDSLHVAFVDLPTDVKPTPTSTSDDTPAPTRTSPLANNDDVGPLPMPLALPTAASDASNNVPSSTTKDANHGATAPPASANNSDGLFEVPRMPLLGELGPAEATLPTKTVSNAVAEPAPLPSPVVAALAPPPMPTPETLTVVSVEDDDGDAPLAVPKSRSRSRFNSFFGPGGLFGRRPTAASPGPSPLHAIHHEGPTHPDLTATLAEDHLPPKVRDNIARALRSMTTGTVGTLSTIGSVRRAVAPTRFVKKMNTEPAIYTTAPHFQKNVMFDFVLGQTESMRFVLAESSDTLEVSSNTQQPHMGTLRPQRRPNPIGDDKVIGWVDVNVSEICFQQMWNFPSFKLHLNLPADMPGMSMSSLIAAYSRDISRQDTHPVLITRPSGVVDAISADAKVSIFIRAEQLDDMDVFGKTDAYFVLYKALGTGLVDYRTDTGHDWKPIYKSEVAFSTNNPEWAGFTLGMDQICSGQYDRQLKVEIYDYERYSHHDLIGTVYITLADIYGASAIREIINQKKKIMYPRRYTKSGVLVFESVELSGIERTFASFVGQGLQLGLCFGVDFGLTNGKTSDPTSLHHKNPLRSLRLPTTLNVYERIMLAFGQALEAYDSSNLIVGYGFGARIPDADGQLNMCHRFNLNGDESNALCAGVYGLLNAYAFARDSVDPWGPVRYSDVLQRFRE